MSDTTDTTENKRETHLAFLSLTDFVHGNHHGIIQNHVPDGNVDTCFSLLSEKNKKPTEFVPAYFNYFLSGPITCLNEMQNLTTVATFVYQVHSLKDAGPIEYLNGLQNLTTVATFVYQILSLKDVEPIEYMNGLQNLTTVAALVYQIQSKQLIIEATEAHTGLAWHSGDNGVCKTFKTVFQIPADFSVSDAVWWGGKTLSAKKTKNPSADTKTTLFGSRGSSSVKLQRLSSTKRWPLRMMVHISRQASTAISPTAGTKRQYTRKHGQAIQSQSRQISIETWER